MGNNHPLFTQDYEPVFVRALFLLILNINDNLKQVQQPILSRNNLQLGNKKPWAVERFMYIDHQKY